MRPLHPPTRVTLYICHPPAAGRKWLVSQAGEPDVQCESEEEARKYSLKLAAFISLSGVQIDVRIEGSDGVWRMLAVQKSPQTNGLALGAMD
jgi:hypothetical protein